jgi:hypothetical protein
MTDKNTKENGGESSAHLTCYVAVLTRLIPVDGCMTDQCVQVISDNDTVLDVMAWAEKETNNSTAIIDVKIIKTT